MKIAVAGSSDYAKILVGLLAARNHKVTVIDKDKEFCEHVCASYDVKAILGNPCQENVLADAGLKDFEMIAAIGAEDTDNFEICQMCRKVFGVRKAVCVVKNPRNVEVFRQLGMDMVINIPEMIADMIG